MELYFLSYLHRVMGDIMLFEYVSLTLLWYFFKLNLHKTSNKVDMNLFSCNVC